MTRVLSLRKRQSAVLAPRAPYNFDANFHKPSHFPSSDRCWEKGRYWTTMVWKGKRIGLRFDNLGTTSRPRIRLNIYSQGRLSDEFVEELIPEIRWRFNFDQDISGFCKRFKNDEILAPVIKRWKGMKPIAAGSLYESLIVYLVLQNATVKRSVQMLENLFNRFGRKARYDGKTLSTFWEPREMLNAGEQELRDLKVGYRAKFFLRITEQFVSKEVNEFALRRMPREEVRRRMLKLYGIGPASVEYLLFECFYFLDALETIPPWEQKIMSRLLFNKRMVPAEKILKFFEEYKPYQKLTFHYLWEDLFWKRRHQHIEWLEKEIRL